MRTNKLLALAVVAFAATLGPTTRPAGAVSFDRAKCPSGKIKATGRKASDKLKCYLKGVKGGEAVESECLAKAEDKFSSSFVKAEGQSVCFATNDAFMIEGKVDTLVTNLVTTLVPNQNESECTSSQLAAAAKKTKSKMGCHAKATKQGEPVDSECLGKAEDTFDKKYLKAASAGDCLTGTAGATVEAAVDSFVADAMDMLRPFPAIRCSGRKIRDAGIKAQDKLQCHQKAAKDGVTVEAACLTDAETKFSANFAKDEGFADCILPPGDTAAVEATVDAFVADIVSTLRPVQTASNCAANKFAETGRETRKRLDCPADVYQFGIPFLPNCLDPVDINFVSAENGGGCLTTGDETVIEGKVQAFQDDIVDQIVGSPSGAFLD